MIFSGRKKIIKKAVADTVSQFRLSTPKIAEHFFYGAFDIAPQNLVVWYLFSTDAELETAKSKGLCDELKNATFKNLVSCGYPKEAFASTDRKVSVAFTTHEDIDRKTNGDYHLYFQ